ncbi:MAG: hypothetical protein JJT77_06930 [Crocinitomicaceae bacterium]|nr:hypothetical protein [Crocinitomicaceae bacterium]
MKQLIINLLVIVSVGAISFLLHNAIIGTSNNGDYSIFGFYLFFAIASIAIVTGVYFTNVYLPDKAAYAFLIGMFLKLGLFMMIFLSKAEQELETIVKINILTPLVIFLILEVFLIFKKLNHQKL